jgi:hypothetical protein
MGRVRIELVAIGLSALASACLVGRDLSLVEPPDTVSGASSPTEASELNPAKDAGSDAPTGGGTTSSDAGKKDSGTKDAASDAKPAPPGDCAPGATSEVEPNDQAIQGTQLEAGTTACGTLIVGSDVDWFQFNLGEGGKTTISFVTDGDAYVAIAGLGNNGTYSGRNNFKTSFEGNGAFYVRIYSPETKPQAYRISRE